MCNYYVTYRCNAKCSFCDIWEQPSPYVTLENVKKNLRDLKALGVKVIDFTGGEPLLHRDLAAMLKLAKDFGFITTVTTNGLLYPKNAEKIAGLVDMLHFSLDSFDKEQHDTWRGVACYDAVIQSVEVARSLNEQPDILFTAFRDNLDQIERVYEQITKPNGLVLIINPAFSYNELTVNTGFNEKDLTFLRSWSSKPGVYLNTAFLSLLEDGGNQVSNPVCKAGTTTIVISPKNELLSPCYHLQKEAFQIENNLLELHRSDEIQQSLKMEGRLPACNGCTINCYMQPSFATHLNKYFWQALPSTLKYNKMKGTWKQLIR